MGALTLWRFPWTIYRLFLGWSFYMRQKQYPYHSWILLDCDSMRSATFKKSFEGPYNYLITMQLELNDLNMKQRFIKTDTLAEYAGVPITQSLKPFSWGWCKVEWKFKLNEGIKDSIDHPHLTLFLDRESSVYWMLNCSGAYLLSKVYWCFRCIRPSLRMLSKRLKKNRELELVPGTSGWLWPHEKVTVWLIED